MKEVKGLALSKNWMYVMALMEVIMDNKNFYDWVMSHEKVYSLLYSPTKIDNKSVREQLFEVKTKDLDWSLDHNSFVYVWGWPGPDYNLYTIKTYGKGWAFSEEEILRAWGELD